jgi:hypothetical protein
MLNRTSKEGRFTPALATKTANDEEIKIARAGVNRPSLLVLALSLPIYFTGSFVKGSLDQLRFSETNLSYRRTL